MNPERDYEVFKSATRKAMPFFAMSIWPILIALLPVIWQIIQLIFADRFEKHGAVSTYESVRGEAGRAERRAIQAFRAAEREVPYL
jgi:hypothetical protein